MYVCSNADIAAQNIRKLNITGSDSPSFATRLSLLITMPEMLKPADDGGSKPTTFVAFTPGTSFQLGHQMGRKEERAVLYVLLRDHLGLRGARVTAALRIFQGGVSTWQKFRDRCVAAVDADNLEPEIRRTFLKEFDQSRVQSRLRKWIARTERPSGNDRAVTVHGNTDQLRVRAEDFNGFVALRNVADAVRAPLTVEYWKSSPYFFNFLRGYRVGENLRDHMKDADRRTELTPLFRGAQRIDKSSVENFQPLEWGNARMRALAAEILDQGWWRLLWMPPSLPYHALAGPYASIDPTAITKSLIFSSWVAAPSAIASLLSYEVERQIFTQAGHNVNTPADRASISSRLDYRTPNGRPSSMSALALFWPQPTLASQTDPLDAAREHRDDPELLGVDRLIEWAQERVENLVGPNGDSRSTTSAPWYWFASVRGEAAAISRLNLPPRQEGCGRCVGRHLRRTRSGRRPPRVGRPRRPDAQRPGRLDAGHGTPGRPAGDHRTAGPGRSRQHRVAGAEPIETGG